MRVALAEDDYIYRAGLVRCLTAAGITVTAAVSSSEELLTHLAAHTTPDGLRGDADLRPVDVVILDIRLSRHRPDEGLATAETIAHRHPGIGILLLSAHAEFHYAQRFYAQGTAGRGYALKENFNNVAAITHALTRVAGGHSYTDPDILDLLLPHTTRARLENLLTARENELLALIAAGMTNTAIAGRLRISPKSVEATATNIFRKLNIPNDPDHNPRVLAALRWHQEHKSAAKPSATQ